jgi:hypothetical protein
MIALLWSELGFTDWLYRDPIRWWCIKQRIIEAGKNLPILLDNCSCNRSP